MLKDIDTLKPHRAHLDILTELGEHTAKNYKELYEYWQKVLNSKELNKKFFQDLSNWYFAAMNEVSFPDDLEKKKDVRNATNLIRLITRVIFIWFIKKETILKNLLFT